MHINDIIESSEKTKLEEIIKEIEHFVEWIFCHHEDRSRRTGKVIHDGVWGTHRYKDFEIAIINTPLIQRLRQIHQTAYTYLTYPSSQHTRFEHTLGVTAQVGNLFKALGDRFSNSPSSDKTHLLDEGIYRSLRIAALMHDCGHGPLSHSSEEIYGNYEEINFLKKYDPFKSAKPHEILSYLILNTSGFKEFLNHIKKDYNVDFDQDLMKNAIVGHAPQPLDRYKVDFLSGPFDADKLDYLFRDGHFSGLPLQIDLDRLWYSIDISNVLKARRLTIDWGGVSSLEQIYYAKMMLFPAVYHHHKVRTCDCMFKGIIEYIQEKAYSLKKNEIELNFGKAIHFLYFTDPEIFGMHGLSQKHEDENLHKLMHNLQYRRLLKRAVVISWDTVKKDHHVKLIDYTKYATVNRIVDGFSYYRWLAKKIWEEAGKPGLLQELWVDCPKNLNFDEADNTWISPLGDGSEPLPLKDYFLINKYADQYKFKKWRSHVFCRPEDTEKVAKACVSVFKEFYGLEFTSLAFQLCHIESPLGL